MERISALMDGELESRQAEQAYALVKDDPEARASWDTFHMISDALRGSKAMRPEFTARVAARLALEPTVVAPRRRVARQAASYVWPAAASLAAIALVGWMAFYSPLVPQPRIATAPVPTQPVAAVAPGPQAAAPAEIASVPSDASVDQYLIAHQEYSPSTAIQGVAPYIRSVSISHPAGGGKE